VFDADRIVADLYRPGAAGARAAEALFGREILDADGSASRPAIARRAFSDPSARRRLEEAIHPLVIAEIRRLFSQAEGAGAPIAVAEASQIFEGGYASEFDRVVVVTAPDEARKARAFARGVAGGELERRSAAQLPPAEARALADDVIENAGSAGDLEEEVAALYSRWTRASRTSAR